MPRRKKTAPATVLSFAEAHLARRLESYETRLIGVLASNRTAVGRLYSSGALFTKRGLRAGRDLLLAHEHLLRVMKLIERLRDEGDIPAPRKADEIEAIFKELEMLLKRTDRLTEHTSGMLEALRGE